jgi:WD40 repeat protein
LDQPRVTLELRDSPTALAYSPDGVFVATVGRDGVLRLWDAKTGARQSLIDVRRPCRAVSFSPDGAHLAVATDEGIHIFDRATYKVIRELPAPQIRSLAFSPNGQTLLAGITSNGQVPTLVELETATGKMRRALFPRPAPLQGLVMAAPVLGVAASAGGETLAALFRSVDVREPANGNVRRPASSSVVNVWDAQTGALRRILPARTTGGALSVSPDGTLVACGGRLIPGQSGVANAAGLAEIVVWDARTGQVRFRRTFDGSPIQSLAFSPDGATLAAGSDAGGARLWNAHTGHPVRSLPARSSGSTYGRANGTVAFSPDGNTLAVSGADKVALWDVSGGG